MQQARGGRSCIPIRACCAARHAPGGAQPEARERGAPPLARFAQSTPCVGWFEGPLGASAHLDAPELAHCQLGAVDAVEVGARQRRAAARLPCRERRAVLGAAPRRLVDREQPGRLLGVREGRAVRGEPAPRQGRQVGAESGVLRLAEEARGAACRSKLSSSARHIASEGVPSARCIGPCSSAAISVGGRATPRAAHATACASAKVPRPCRLGLDVSSAPAWSGSVGSPDSRKSGSTCAARAATVGRAARAVSAVRAVRAATAAGVASHRAARLSR